MVGERVCWSRRKLMGAVSKGASVGLLLRISPADASDKMTRQQAEYQDTPNGIYSCGVCTLFEPPRAVDLYGDVVLKATEWPTRDHSIKTLAKYLGFTWRDGHPSGAASVEWFDRWCRERHPDIRQRILDYNEDDCRATRVLLDGIRSLAA